MNGWCSEKASNSEIILRFYDAALEDKSSSYKESAAEWVSRQGRMKVSNERLREGHLTVFCLPFPSHHLQYNRPIYRALFKIDPELARKTFKANQSFYHPIAASMIEKVSFATRSHEAW